MAEAAAEQTPVAEQDGNDNNTTGEVVPEATADAPAAETEAPAAANAAGAAAAALPRRVDDKEKPGKQDAKQARKAIKALRALVADTSVSDAAKTQRLADQLEAQLLELALLKRQREAMIVRDLRQSELIDSMSLRDGKLSQLLDKLMRENVEMRDRLRTSEERFERFSGDLASVTAKIDEQNTATKSQSEVNEKLVAQLQSMEQQMLLRDEHHAKLIKTKDLELQLAQLKLEQADKIAKATQEELERQTANVHQLLETEKKQREQLQEYGEQFVEVQATMKSTSEYTKTFDTKLKESLEKQVKLLKDLQVARDRADKAEGVAIQYAQQLRVARAAIDTLKASSASGNKAALAAESAAVDASDAGASP